MASRFSHLVIDSREPSVLAEFWAAVLDQPADVPWVVLTDPEGNEFCVLRPHASLIE
ncbi:hypothetical protein [Actinomadura coerulea]|uniref:hypothetical protein n=1 Tax=Actinomadura coerulea TaxID=46159 RepID=UPI00343D1912